MLDAVKFVLIAGGYLVAAPVLGWLLVGRRDAQRWVFALMVFMTSWHINKLTLMFQSVEWYRGHTKGYEGCVIHVLALGLLWAGRLGGATDFRWLPPGARLWLVHCGLGLLSLAAAPEPSFALMAAWKFASAVVVFAAAYHHLREEADLDWLLRALAATLVVQALVVLKMKYVDGHYQVRGWFEHQNPLSMWAYLLGLPLLGAALGPAGPVATRWYLAGFAASAVIVQASLSRASLAAFAAGVAAVAVIALWDGFTLKRLRVLFVLGCAGLLGLVATLDTIVARFRDEGNQASGETRTVMNLASAAMLRDSAVGIGWNNFAVTINPPFPYGEVIDDWQRARGHRVDPDYAKGVVESHYWLLLAENGYPGLISYLVFLGVTGWWIVRGMVHHRGRPAGAFLGGLAVALALIYLHSNLERVLTQTKNLATWMILLGIVARLEHDRKWRNPSN
jgi:hypothetical protein